MKAYGHGRRDKLECRFGCCTTKSGVNKLCRHLVDRAKRKRARQQGKKTAKADFSSSICHHANLP